MFVEALGPFARELLALGHGGNAGLEVQVSGVGEAEAGVEVLELDHRLTAVFIGRRTGDPLDPMLPPVHAATVRRVVGEAGFRPDAGVCVEAPEAGRLLPAVLPAEQSVHVAAGDEVAAFLLIVEEDEDHL